MENNFPTISDTELRNLLNQFILMDKQTHLQKQIIDMEATIAINTLPASLTSLAIQESLLRKFRYKLLQKTLFKWLIIATITTATGVGLYTLAKQFYKNEIKPVTPPVIQENTAGSISPFNNEKNALSSLLSNNTNDFFQPTLTFDPNMLLVPKNIFNSFENPLFTDHQMNVPIENIPGQWNKFPLPANNSNSFDSTILLTGIKKVSVTSDYCHINIQGGSSDNKTKVSYSMSYIDAVQYSNDSTFEFSKKQPLKQKITWQVIGDELIVNIGLEKKKNVIMFSSKKTMNAYLDIQLPGIERLIINNHSGNINCKEIHSGQLFLKNEYGNCTMENISAESNIDIHTGNINLNKHIGNLKTKLDYGNFTFNDIEGALAIKCGTGHITGKNIDGDCKIENEYGNISLTTLKGNTCTIDLHTGHCTIFSLQYNQSMFKLDYGNLVLTNTISKIKTDIGTGNITIENNIGEISLNSNYGHQNIRNNKGRINLVLGTGNAVCHLVEGDLNIDGSYSNVSVTDIKGDLNITTSTGKITGTTVTLKSMSRLKSEYGNISLKPTNTIDDLSCELSSEYGTVSVNKNNTVLSKKNGDILLHKGSIKISATTHTGNILIE